MVRSTAHQHETNRNGKPEANRIGWMGKLKEKNNMIFADTRTGTNFLIKKPNRAAAKTRLSQLLIVIPKSHTNTG